MIAQFQIILKGHEVQEKFRNDELYGINGPSILIRSGSGSLIEKTSKKMNRLLYFSNNCEIHKQGSVTDQVTKTNSFTQLYRVAC